MSGLLRGRPPALIWAWLLGGLVLALIAASVVLTVVTGNLTASSDGSVIALAFVFLAVGFLVAVRQPANPIGWVLIATGLATAFTIASSLYTLDDFSRAGGGLPLGRPVLFAENAGWALAIVVGMTTLLLFPDGRLSRGWRRVLAGYAAAGLLVLASQAVSAWYLVTLPRLRMDAGGMVLGMHRPGGAIGFFSTGLPVLVLVPFWLAWIARLVIGFRRSAGATRQQFKWFTAGAVFSLAGVVVMTVAESGGSQAALTSVVNVAATYAVVAFPLGMGLGILRYRLFEIDRIISRTLGYALVSGLLIGVYAGLVLLAIEVLRFGSSVSVAVATLAAAALFSPLRRRVQRVVDRRFNRARYDADQMVAGFAARLKDAVDLDTVRDDLATAVQRALEPARVSVWLTRDSE
ncbi:MAG TPA: hypothetical protein VMH35_18095 [Streptosporangiaceae bacterium]|nr:hypothetical protein [Streptosporangiaceae bacterium]